MPVEGLRGVGHFHLEWAWQSAKQDAPTNSNRRTLLDQDLIFNISFFPLGPYCEDCRCSTIHADDDDHFVPDSDDNSALSSRPYVCFFHSSFFVPFGSSAFSVVEPNHTLSKGFVLFILLPQIASNSKQLFYPVRASVRTSTHTPGSCKRPTQILYPKGTNVSIFDILFHVLHSHVSHHHSPRTTNQKNNRRRKRQSVGFSVFALCLVGGEESNLITKNCRVVLYSGKSHQAKTKPSTIYHEA